MLKLSNQTFRYLVVGLVLIIWCSILLGTGFAKPDENRLQVHNIILLIGDGMGIAHISLARLATVGADGQLNMDKFPYVGLVKTHSANDIVTDSAAAGTALATGRKTNNGMVSIGPNEEPFTTVLERAERVGKVTGLITTVSIVHATPAVFAAHIANRAAYPEIANQMLNHNIEVLLGGGRIFFIPSTALTSQRKDNLDLLKEAVNKGYSVISTSQQLSEDTSHLILGLFANDAFIGAKQEPSLADMVNKSITVLSKSTSGFFLMAEGGQIDWKAHANQQDAMVKETQEFDAAVGKALGFAQSRNDTLVIVTADHETGGLAILADKDKGFRSGWNTTGHSGTMVAVFAYGPTAERFTGVHDNTDIGKFIADTMKNQ